MAFAFRAPYGPLLQSSAITGPGSNWLWVTVLAFRHCNFTMHRSTAHVIAVTQCTLPSDRNPLDTTALPNSLFRIWIENLFVVQRRYTFGVARAIVHALVWLHAIWSSLLRVLCLALLLFDVRRQHFELHCGMRCACVLLNVYKGLPSGFISTPKGVSRFLWVFNRSTPSLPDHLRTSPATQSEKLVIPKLSRGCPGAPPGPPEHLQGLSRRPPGGHNIQLKAHGTILNEHGVPLSAHDA